MEYCDVYDGSGNRTGRTVVRGTALPEGEYYLVVHVWIRNEAGEYLIQQRAWDRDTDPGVWATTAGSVLAGEDSLAAALREAAEELGVHLFPEQLRRFDRLWTDDRVEDLWIAEVLKQPANSPTLNSEVADWKWASKGELKRLIERGEFFPYSYFDRLPE